MSRFTEYATSTALSVSVSKSQVDMLCAFAQGFSITDASHFITTFAALERKGFAHKKIVGNRDKEYPTYTYALTKAGEIMVELIKEAELFIEYKMDDHNILAVKA